MWFSLFGILVVLFNLGWLSYLTISRWRDSTGSQKIYMSSMIVIFALSFVCVVYGTWTQFPWGRASAFRTANAFMTDLNKGNYTNAIQKLSYVTQEQIGVDDLNKPDIRPVSWQLISVEDSDSADPIQINGKAIFADDTELPIQMKMDWYNGRWRIYGVTFGEWREDKQSYSQANTRLDFTICCDYWPILDDIYSLVASK